MHLETLLYGAPSAASVGAGSVSTEPATYMQADGTLTGSLTPATDAATAPTAGALALLAVGGLIAMRYLFRGALD